MAKSAHKLTPKPVKKKALPEWDLSDFYSSPSSPEVAKDFKRVAQLCESFRAQYDGKVTALSAADLARAIAEYEVVQELIGRLGSYAYLVFAKNMTQPEGTRFYQNTQEMLTQATSKILFFALAINRMEDADMAQKLAYPPLKHYMPWLRDVRAFRPYQLSDDLEKLLHEKHVTGRGAWTRLFDETIASLRFPYKGKKLTEPQIFEYMSSKNPKERRAAAAVIGKVFKENAKLFALITNTLAKDKETEDSWRGFKQPISARNVSNYIEDEVVEALSATVRKNYKHLSHRYYKLKAGWFGKKQLDYWDRNAPLPDGAEKKYTWQEACDLVLGAYASFSPELAAQGRKFFDHAWIDAAPTPGKSPGAFAHPTVPSVHPYLLVNFMGRPRDVMTLAHELGHGVHQVLAAKQGTLMCDTPLTLAETASVFGEQLTFQEMVRRETNEKRRKRLIAAKVEDMLNTVVRQIAFLEFEKRVHAERRGGELSLERLNRIWMDVQAESLGPAIKLSGDYPYFWTYIPHFIHSPFYVYAYAFGDCLVNSLYAVYEKERSQGREAAFERNYLEMLAAGGTLRHKDLLAPFGLDATRHDFWQQGLNILSSMIDALE